VTYFTTLPDDGGRTRGTCSTCRFQYTYSPYAGCAVPNCTSHDKWESQREYINGLQKERDDYKAALGEIAAHFNDNTYNTGQGQSFGSIYMYEDINDILYSKVLVDSWLQELKGLLEKAGVLPLPKPEKEDDAECKEEENDDGT
jgi:hypothetical protein